MNWKKPKKCRTCANLSLEAKEKPETQYITVWASLPLLNPSKEIGKNKYSNQRFNLKFLIELESTEQGLSG
jgi:hypothetical protein